MDDLVQALAHAISEVNRPETCEDLGPVTRLSWFTPLHGRIYCSIWDGYVVLNVLRFSGPQELRSIDLADPQSLDAIAEWLTEHGVPMVFAEPADQR